MGDVGELSAADIAFLEPYLPSQDATRGTRTWCSTDTVEIRKEDMPFVTLTYASSLDSMIALAVGARTTLSGPETKCMTHYLRLRHDAILIGSGTAQVDDPGLNCRYPGVTLDEQPRPVVVDPRRNWIFGREDKVVKLASEGKGKGPWIVALPETKPSAILQSVGGGFLTLEGTTSFSGTVDSDRALGAVPVPWTEILRGLKQRGIDSVMIEGGARVINSLLAMPQLVDAVILTIAPTWLGSGGVAVQPPARTDANGQRVNSAWLGETSWRQFGNDIVLCGRLDSERWTE